MENGKESTGSQAVGSRSLNLGVATALIAAQLAPLPVLGGVIGVSAAAAQSGKGTFTIPCQSVRGQSNSCRLPANTTSVRFLGPDRSGICREGDSWRRSGDTLEVRNGCGGTFEATTRGGSSGWGGNSGGNWGNSGNWNNGGNWGNNGQGFAGEVTCRSQNNRQQVCSVNTGGRVQMLQQYSSSSCIEGQSWRADNRSITVRNGCQARFGYGYGNSGGNWNNGGNNNGNWGGNQGFAGQIECRSENNRNRRCGANTQNRVELLRQFSSTNCQQGRNWGYDRNGVWVDNGCQARFGYGYGNVTGDTSGSGGGGSNTGAVIGGVALAAGLVALLAAAGKSGNNSRSSAAGGDAKLTADLTKFPSDARQSGQACLNEASRQVGATGGTAVRLDSVDSATRDGNGWAIRARATGTYPDHSQSFNIDCRANGSSVTAFDIR